jgi:hypothetical protein
MRSIRVDPTLDRTLRQASAQEGVSVSEFIRRAVAERVERTLSARDQLLDVVGVVRSRGGAAARTGEAFGELLAGTREGKQRGGDGRNTCGEH